MTSSSSKPDNGMASQQAEANPAGLEAFLTYRLHLLNKLTDRVTEERYQGQLGVSLGMARCVAALGNFGSLSVNTLAARANLDKSQASRLAQALVRRRDVFKVVSPHDQRGVELNLSRQGEVLYRRIQQIATERNDEVFGCLTATERTTFDRLMARLLRAAKREEDDL